VDSDEIYPATDSTLLTSSLLVVAILDPLALPLCDQGQGQCVGFIWLCG